MKKDWEDNYFAEIFKGRKSAWLLIFPYVTFLCFVEFAYRRLPGYLCEHCADSMPMFRNLCFLWMICVVILSIIYVWPKMFSVTFRFDHYFYIASVSMCIYVAFFLRVLGHIFWCLYIPIVSLTLLMIIVRKVQYREVFKRVEEYAASIYNLEDIYNGKVKIVRKSKNAPILLSDKVANDDLLGRNHIVNSLEAIIKNARPQSSFVIGLEGEWGSGKSTIINLVKNRLKEGVDKSTKSDNFILCSINPWLYNDNETFLIGVFDTIMKDADIKYSVLQRRRILAVINELLSKNSATSYLSTLLSTPLELSDELQDIKNRIKRYLEATDKVIVFFIDEIDRTLPENIFFMLKVLSVVLDLDRTIYVLSYDRDEISNILHEALHIDNKYLEKIVQMRIKVDVPSPTSKSVYEKCLYKILEAYNETFESPEYAATIAHICSAIGNIREFKRFINSGVSTAMLHGKGLYKPNLLALEYIKYANNELYQKLFANRHFLVSCDMPSNENIYNAVTRMANPNLFKKLQNEFLQEIKNDNENLPYINILEDLFPLVSRNIEDDLEKLNEKISKNAGIASAKYVDLYFTYATNEHIIIKEVVEQFIDEINGITDVAQAASVFVNQIKNLNAYQQQIWIDNFCLLAKDRAYDKAPFIVEMLFKSVHYLSEDIDKWLSSPQNKAVWFIAELLMKLDDDSFDAFMKQAAKSYSKLHVIASSANYLRGRDGAGSVYNRVNKYYENMCGSILKEKIDIYTDENYHFHNLWGIMFLYKNYPDTIRRYLFDVASKDNIYRILGDFVTYALGKTYGYIVQDEIKELLLTDAQLTSKLDNILNERPPKTESEELVLKVYKFRDEQRTDLEERFAVSLPRAFHLDL